MGYIPDPGCIFTTYMHKTDTSESVNVHLKELDVSVRMLPRRSWVLMQAVMRYPNAPKVCCYSLRI